MNARAVNALAGVIHAAMQRHQTAAGIAVAVESAGLLMSPEMASLLEHAREASRSEVLPEDRLAAIRARAEAATEGPWCTDSWEIYQGAEYAAGATWIGETCRAGDTEGACADAEFIAAARTDVPLLLAEADRLRAELADASNLRDHWHTEARASYDRITALEADRTADVPRLRQTIREWSKRCREAEAEQRSLRADLGEAQARLSTTPPQQWFLADYEGAEDGPTLHVTLDSAQEWVRGWSAGDPYWDWIEQDGVWEQWTCDPDTDRPVNRWSGTVTRVTLAAVAAGGAS